MGTPIETDCFRLTRKFIREFLSWEFVEEVSDDALRTMLEEHLSLPNLEPLFVRHSLPCVVEKDLQIVPDTVKALIGEPQKAVTGPGIGILSAGITGLSQLGAEPTEELTIVRSAKTEGQDYDESLVVRTACGEYAA